MQIFDGIFRCYAVVIAVFVVVAETEWEFIMKFSKVSSLFHSLSLILVRVRDVCVCVCSRIEMGKVSAAWRIELLVVFFSVVNDFRHFFP